MKSTILWALAIAGPSFSSAIHLAPRSANPRVLGLDIQRYQTPNILPRGTSRLRRRQKTVQETLDNEGLFYFANITVGTPPQSVRVTVDTGSSDLWVNLPNSSICESASDACIGGTYSPGSSSTYKFVNNDFNATYADGSSASGPYVSDTVGIGGVSIESLQFGLGETSNLGQGILGVGYPLNEDQVATPGAQPYPNLPEALVNGGHINRNVYSLWLNDLDANTGTILFGGVNTAMYQGDLKTLPVLTIAGGYYHFIIAMTSFSFNGSAVTSGNLPIRMLLDSGTSLSYLPSDIVAAIYRKIGVDYDERQGVAYAYCDLADTNSFIEFGFNGANIQVPFNELLIEVTDEQGNIQTFPNGKQACAFGIAPVDGNVGILGDTFLRSAYVVYDITNNEVSIAQTVFNATGDDIREIASGTSAVPGASPAPSSIYTFAAGTATNFAQIGSQTTTLTGLAGGGQGGPTTKITGSITGATSVTAGTTRKSSSNGGCATQMPYVAGAAALMAGVGLIV